MNAYYSNVKPVRPPISEVAVERWLETCDLSSAVEANEGFLAATSSASASPAARLWALAVVLENDVSWKDLVEIYRAAHRVSPWFVPALQSWGVSAERRMSAEPDKQVEIARSGLDALRKAEELEPGVADTIYCAGLIRYNLTCIRASSGDDRGAALESFQRAVDTDPAHDMANLYLGHCLHDLERWSAAAAAYRRVDLERLRRDWPLWRSLKLQEQLASCLAFSGAQDESRVIFTRLFDEIDALPDDEVREEVFNLDEAIEALGGPLADSPLLERARGVIRRADVGSFCPGLVEESEAG